MSHPHKTAWILPAAAALVLVVAVSALVFGPAPMQSPKSEQPVVTETPETPPSEPENEESPCPADWAQYAVDSIGLSFCAPAEYGDATEATASGQTHVTFSNQEDAEVLFVSTSAEGESESDATEMVSFECLETTIDGGDFATCFDSQHRVNRVSRVELSNGLNAYEADIELFLLEGTDSYRQAWFILVPYVAQGNHHAEIAVMDGAWLTAHAIADSFMVYQPAEEPAE